MPSPLPVNPIPSDVADIVVTRDRQMSAAAAMFFRILSANGGIAGNLQMTVQSTGQI